MYEKTYIMTIHYGVQILVKKQNKRKGNKCRKEGQKEKGHYRKDCYEDENDGRNMGK
jgi:hypothetical protein